METMKGVTKSVKFLCVEEERAGSNDCDDNDSITDLLNVHISDFGGKV